MKANQAGRPLEVHGGERTSILLGSAERLIVDKAAKEQLGSTTPANRSRTIRRMIRTSWDRDREDLKESWKKDLIIADLQAKLAVSEKLRLQLEADLMRARRPKGKKSHTLDLLLQHKAAIRRLVDSGSRSPLGHQVLDQFWHNRGRSWATLLREIELAEELGQWPLPAQAVVA